MTLPAEGFALYDIAHPTDPQVNGFGFYRSVDGGTTPLLFPFFSHFYFPLLHVVFFEFGKYSSLSLGA